MGDMGTAFGGLTGKSKEDFGHGAAWFVPYTNVFDNPVGDASRLERVEIDPSQNVVRGGDALFTVSSETPEEVGMSCVWPSDLDNLYLNSFCFGYRQDGTFDPSYLAYMLRADSFRNQVEMLAQGISRFNISKGKVMEVEVPVPDKEEQALIGRFFVDLDNLITLHQRKQGNVWHKNGAWNGLTNPQVVITPLAASNPSCTPTVARMDAADGADRVAAGSVPMAQTFVCAPGGRLRGRIVRTSFRSAGGCPAPLGVSDMSRDAMPRRLNVRISDGELEVLDRASAEMGCSRSQVVRLLVHCLADGGTRMGGGHRRLRLRDLPRHRAKPVLRRHALQPVRGGAQHDRKGRA